MCDIVYDILIHENCLRTNIKFIVKNKINIHSMSRKIRDTLTKTIHKKVKTLNHKLLFLQLGSAYFQHQMCKN